MDKTCKTCGATCPEWNVYHLCPACEEQERRRADRGYGLRKDYEEGRVLLELLPDEDLVALCDSVISHVSYYRAAEGSSYWREAEPRRVAEEQFYAVQAEMNLRGLRPTKPGLTYWPPGEVWAV